MQRRHQAVDVGHRGRADERQVDRGRQRHGRGLHVQGQAQHDSAAQCQLPGGQHVLDRRGGGQPVECGAHRLRQPGQVDREVGQRVRRLRCQQEQRRAALGGLGQTGQRVGDARALMHRDHADPAGQACVRVRGRDRTGFVSRRHEPGTSLDQRVGDMEVAAADDAERVLDTEAAEHRAGERGGIHGAAGHRITVRQVRAPEPGCRNRARSAAGPRSPALRWPAGEPGSAAE